MLHVFTMYNHIKKTMLKQKFRPLKITRKCSFYCFLNYSGTCKTNQRLWFGNSNICQ